jgi:hypothetical protein
MKVRSTENLIQDAWKLYKRNLSNFIIVGLIFTALTFIFAFLIILSFFFIPFLVALLVNYASKTVVIFIIASILLFILIFLLLVSYQDVIFILVAQEAFSHKSALALSLIFKKGIKKLWPYFWVNLIVTLIITLGLIFFIIPGIIAGLFLFFVKYLIIADGIRGLRSLKLSIKATSDHLGQVFILVSLFIISSVISNSFGGAGILTMLLVYPMMTCVSFLLYTDIKKNKKLI